METVIMRPRNWCSTIEINSKAAHDVCQNKIMERQKIMMMMKTKAYNEPTKETGTDCKIGKRNKIR